MNGLRKKRKLPFYLFLKFPVLQYLPLGVRLLFLISSHTHTLQAVIYGIKNMFTESNPEGPH